MLVYVTPLCKYWRLSFVGGTLSRLVKLARRGSGLIKVRLISWEKAATEYGENATHQHTPNKSRAEHGGGEGDKRRCRV